VHPIAILFLAAFTFAAADRAAAAPVDAVSGWTVRQVDGSRPIAHAAARTATRPATVPLPVPAPASRGTAGVEPAPPKSAADVRALAAAAAADHGIPLTFFTRLISQESGFNSGAVSPVGAQGIAQFMPATAAERGLADPFDPKQALPKSAELLRDLERRFGNLGLAAAAYNAGPARIDAWLAGTAALPYETQTYVLAITGRRAEDWAPPAVRDRLKFAPAPSFGAMFARATMSLEQRLLSSVARLTGTTPTPAPTLLTDTASAPRRSRRAARHATTAAELTLCRTCLVRAAY
jgi:soluble lytic murein transglycosylase-like protein